MKQKISTLLFFLLFFGLVGISYKSNQQEEILEIPLEPIKQINFKIDCGNLPSVIIDESKKEFEGNYLLRSMQYSDNGICLRFDLKEGINAKIHIEKDNEILYNYTLVFNNKYHEADLNLSNLENGVYALTITTDTKENLINNLDMLEQIVRGKIKDKLVTFSYEQNKIIFTVSDFAYEYDILIDPGHGGIDAGTQNRTALEKDMNLAQSLYEQKRFEEHGLKVFMARTDSGDGLLTGSSEWNRAKKRGYAIGYYGVVSKYVYSNHHNYMPNANTGGFEIIVSNLADKNTLKTELEVYKSWVEIYPKSLRTNNLAVYSRDYLTGDTLNKVNAEVINKIDWYATIRIPLQLYNVYTTTYEGCYLQNSKDFNWYYNEGNWKKLSEAKIKAYVEALGKTYVPVS